MRAPCGAGCVAAPQATRCAAALLAPLPSPRRCSSAAAHRALPLLTARAPRRRAAVASSARSSADGGDADADGTCAAGCDTEPRYLLKLAALAAAGAAAAHYGARVDLPLPLLLPWLGSALSGVFGQHAPFDFDAPQRRSGAHTDLVAPRGVAAACEARAAARKRAAFAFVTVCADARRALRARSRRRGARRRPSRG